MSEAKLYIDVLCPDCGHVMIRNRDELYCDNHLCVNYEKLYKAPTITLETAGANNNNPTISKGHDPRRNDAIRNREQRPL